MHEILFRGKRKGNNFWIRGDLVRINNICYIYIAGIPREVAPETVGQYTGVTDKNGVKIFEGDILSTPKWKGVVTWGDGYGGYCVQHGINRPAIDIVMNEFDVEVIGNIYDNPELMEGK